MKLSVKSRVLFNFFILSVFLVSSFSLVQADEARPNGAKPEQKRATGLIFADEWELSGFGEKGDDFELTFREMNGKRNIKVSDDDGVLTLRTLHMTIMGPITEAIYEKFTDNKGWIDLDGNPVPIEAAQMAREEWDRVLKRKEVSGLAGLKPTLLLALKKWSEATARAIKKLEQEGRTSGQDYANQTRENIHAKQLYEYIARSETLTYENIQNSLSAVLEEVADRHTYLDSKGEKFKFNDKTSEHPLAQLFSSRPIFLKDGNAIKMKEDRQDLVIGFNVLQEKRQRARAEQKQLVPEAFHDGGDVEGPAEVVSPDEVTDRGDVE